MSDPEQSETRDGFAAAREGAGVFVHEDRGERIPLILRHRDVRAAARDWQTYSSDAPFRVPIPSEEGVRRVRQIPIELDPPLHGTYRKLIEPFFLRAASPEFIARIETLVFTELDAARAAGTVEAMGDVALPLQSRALALLLGLPTEEADKWIGWGNSVYREGDGAGKGAELDAYIREQLARARDEPDADDFFALLTRLELDDRPLGEDEVSGIANLAFAGGRDTVINSIVEILAHFARHPEDLTSIAADPRLIPSAVEEFVRFVSPLSFIGRVCPDGANIGGERVSRDGRIGLCWASANFDAEVFDDPDILRLDRKPNPHMGFGSGRHACLGAAHARGIMRALIGQLVRTARQLEIVEEEPAYEMFGTIRRRLSYKRLVMRFA